jgi:hypothetical protein
MDEVAVDIEEAGPVLTLFNQVVVPDLVIECLGGGHVRIVPLFDRRSTPIGFRED